MSKFVSAIWGGAAIGLVLSTPAFALNTRTWVSGVGTDQAGCGPIANPCRTLQYAHDVTSAGGEINFKDSAGYGALNITKAINVVNEGGAIAGVLAPSGNSALTINAGNGDAVVLRGLTIEGAGVGANGVVFNSGGSLLIGNCFVQGFAGSDENHGNGILFKHTVGIPQIVITDTTVSNNGWTGVLFRPTVGGTGRVTVNRLVATNNAFGLSADSRYTAVGPYQPEIVIRDSIASNNSQNGFGFYANSSSYTKVSLISSTAANNDYGLFLSGFGVFVTMTNSSLLSNRIYNLEGSNPSNSGVQVTTFGDNAVTNMHQVSYYAFGRY